MYNNSNNSVVIPRPEDIVCSNIPITDSAEMTDAEIEENNRRFGWALPYPPIVDPDDELDKKWGDCDDYKRYKAVCYDYGIKHNQLVNYMNIQEVYGKTYDELNEAEKAAYKWVSYHLEYHFEVCCGSW